MKNQIDKLNNTFDKIKEDKLTSISNKSTPLPLHKDAININSFKINTIPSCTANPTTNKTNTIHYWHEKPLGKIGIGIFIGIITFLTIYLINKYVLL